MQECAGAGTAEVQGTGTLDLECRCARRVAGGGRALLVERGDVVVAEQARQVTVLRVWDEIGCGGRRQRHHRHERLEARDAAPLELPRSRLLYAIKQLGP